MTAMLAFFQITGYPQAKEELPKQLRTYLFGYTTHFNSII